MSAACIPYSCRASARHAVDESDYLQSMKCLFKVTTISLDTDSTDVSEDSQSTPRGYSSLELSVHLSEPSQWGVPFEPTRNLPTIRQNQGTVPLVRTGTLDAASPGFTLEQKQKQADKSRHLVSPRDMRKSIDDSSPLFLMKSGIFLQARAASEMAGRRAADGICYLRPVLQGSNEGGGAWYPTVWLGIVNDSLTAKTPFGLAGS